MRVCACVCVKEPKLILFDRYWVGSTAEIMKQNAVGIFICFSLQH